MKLARRLIFAVMAAIVAVLAANLWLRVRRDREALRADQVRDHQFIGRTLRATVLVIWRTDGLERAQLVIHAADESYADILVRLDRVGEGAGPTSLDRAPLAAADLAELERGQELSWERSGTATSMFPLRSPEGRLYALEVSEPLGHQDRFVRESIVRNLVITLIVVLVCGVSVLVLGRSMVGVPLSKLREKARRIGNGELSGPLVLEQQDEVGELATEINAMCERLAEAQRALEAQTRARLDALEQLRHADRLRTVGQLASGLAHELGTPLNVVLGRASLLAAESTDPSVQENAALIAEQARRMTGLIRQLMDFARRRGPRRLEVDAGALVQGTVALLGPLAQKSAVKLELVDNGEGIRVFADPEQLRQVLSNLVVNAVQAMPEGGAVTIACREEVARNVEDGSMGPEPCCVLSVRDRGVGIPADALPQLFEPFFTTKDVGEGTGLGLSVAHGIVHDHGGWLTVESAAGEGSCFTVYLPLRRDAMRPSDVSGLLEKKR